MSQNPFKKKIKQGEQFFVSGNFEQALSLFEDVLAKDPDNIDALNDAALTYAELDRFVDAVQCLERVLQQEPGHTDAFFNLIDLLRDTGETDLVIDAFDAYSDSISASDELEQYRAHVEALKALRPKTASASGTGPQPWTELSTTGRLKLAFICGPDTKFLEPLEKALAGTYHVRILHFTDTVELAAIQQMMDWADVTWFEWCDRIVVEASRKLRKTSKVVCRLHSYEVFTDFCAHVNWPFVDRLLFVAPHIERLFKRRVREAVQTVVVPNGVDLGTLAFTERKPSFNLAYVGYLNFKKNPELLLQCMAELVRRDPRYVLHIAGSFQEARYQLYFEKMIPAMGLQNNVVLDGWVEDIDAWLEDKSYLVSTSVLESFGYGIAEAMSKGLKPIIHNWVGAEDIYPTSLLFNTTREFCDRVQAADYDSRRYRDFIERHYGRAIQLRRLHTLLDALVPPDATPHFREQANNRYQPIEGFWLREDEAIQFFMAPHRFFGRFRDLIPDEVILQQIQNAFKALAELYFNGAAPQAFGYDGRYLLELLQTDFFADDAAVQGLLDQLNVGSLDAIQSIQVEVIELLLTTLYPVLSERLAAQSPIAEETVDLAGMLDDKTFRPEDARLAATYDRLREAVQPVEDMIHTFVVHGSTATLDYTPYSDVDTLVIMNADAFASREALRRCRQAFSAAAVHLFAFDPIQHHRFFFASAMDLQWYPESYLPLAVLREATGVVGASTFAVRTRPATLEIAYAVWSMAYYFRQTFIERSYPETLFDLKRFTSRLMLMPTLYLEAAHNVFPYKRDSFEQARPHFSMEAWQAIETATAMRATWNPHTPLRAAAGFYEAAFLLAEECLTGLIASSNTDASDTDTDESSYAHA